MRGEVPSQRLAIQRSPISLASVFSVSSRILGAERLKEIDVLKGLRGIRKHQSRFGFYRSVTPRLNAQSRGTEQQFRVSQSKAA
jgi:hypothetical protein